MCEFVRRDIESSRTRLPIISAAHAGRRRRRPSQPSRCRSCCWTSLHISRTVTEPLGAPFRISLGQSGCFCRQTCALALKGCGSRLPLLLILLTLQLVFGLEPTLNLESGGNSIDACSKK